jgi:pullulanase
MHWGRTVGFTIDGRPTGDAWERILVVYNDEPAPLTVELPDGRWEVVVNAETAGNATISAVGGKATLPAYSMLVAHGHWPKSTKSPAPQP